MKKLGGAFALSLVVGMSLGVWACSDDKTSEQPSQPAGFAKVDRLFNSPTQSLVDEMLAQHVATDDEVRLALVFWGGIRVTLDTGALPEEFVTMGLSEEVLRLAEKYPSFFQKTGADYSLRTMNVGPLSLDPITGVPSDGCAERCIPPLTNIGSTLLTCAESGAGILKGIKAYREGDKLLAIWSRFADGAKRILPKSPNQDALQFKADLTNTIKEAAEGDFLGAGLSLVDGTTAIVAALGTVGIVTSPAVIGGALLVGTASALVQCGMGINHAANLYSNCTAWKSTNKCDEGAGTDAGADAGDAGDAAAVT